MDKPLLKFGVMLAAAALLAACSAPTAPAPATTATTQPKEPPPPPGPVAARSAFFEMYKPARTWATDLLPLTLTAGEVPGIQNEGGKAGMWTAVFVSPSRREARTFFYSVADHGSDIHKGVSAGGAQPWSGMTPKSRPFQVTEFAVNSDDAYKTAYTKAAPWLKTHPGRKCSLFLASSSRFPTPVWMVLWGDTKNGYLAFVDSTTGMVVSGR